MPMFEGYTTPVTDEQRLAQIAAKLDEWTEYVHQERPVLPNSSLASDDALFPLFPPSSLAWHGMSSAVDHLEIFMNAVAGGKSHPLAPQTLARTGMVSAAHALWLLDGRDRPTRQKRGLQLAYFEFSEDHKAVRDIAKLPDADLAALQPYLDTREKWMERAITRGAGLGMSEGQVTTLNDTDLLDHVCRDIAHREPDLDDIVGMVRVLWRLYSGSAHGLRWPVMFRADLANAGPADASGTTFAQATNDFSDLTMAASGVAIFLARAINSFEIRRRPA